MQTVPLRCRCGTVRGEVEAGQAYGHAICYRRDCQAWAAWIEDAGMTDGRGGTGIVATSPERVRITHGRDGLACISLGPKGLLRWYATCCRTAIANTPRDAKVAYVGLIAASLDRREGGAAAAFGPPRFVLNPKSAPVPVDGTPVATLLGGLRIVLGGAPLR